jgi:hypothetical protein
MTKALVKKTNGGAVAAYDYGTSAGEGFEGTTGADLSVPFLSILQPLSPQVQDKDPEGAEAGQIYNTVTRELASAKDGVVFLPCHKDLSYVEWVPREKGGGFAAIHDPQSDEVKDAIIENGGSKFGGLTLGENDLIETHYVYGLVLDAKGVDVQGFAVISFTSTKIKPFKDWLTAMFTLRGKPPIYANRSVIKSVRVKNEKGTFHNFRIDPLKATWRESLIDPTVNPDLLEEAKAFREMVLSGMARASFETERSTGDSSAGSSGGDAEDAPF